MKDEFRNRLVHTRAIEPLEHRVLLAFDSLVISEFNAKNDSAFVDGDGDNSDWIEIYNPTDETVDLEGWSLTDNDAELSKWIFPSVDLAPNAYQLVFASDKNRRVSGEELHTNFKLSADGEYLALADPNGVITSDFSPTFPQFEDGVSFGFSTPRSTLVDDSFRYAVAEADVSDWSNPDFDDTDWDQGNGAIGFSISSGFPNSGFEHGDLSEWESLGTASVEQESFGFTPRDGANFAIIESAGSTATRRGAERFLDLDQFALDQLVDQPATRISALKRDITVHAGSVLEFDWQLLTNDRVNQDFGFVSISDGTGLQLLDTADNANQNTPTVFLGSTSVQTFRHRFSTAGTFTIGVGVAQTFNTVSDSAIALDKVLLDGVGETASSYASILTTDVADRLANSDKSLWVRYEFQLGDPTSVRGVELNARFDDGFVAYVNGTEIVSRNVPPELRWNSTATDTRPNRDATAFEPIQLSATSLQTGRNVLAIQVLNHASDTADLLWQADVFALGRLSNEPTFLSPPTPGRANIDRTISFLEPVEFDTSAGFYESPVSLAMSVDAPGVTIHYTLDGSPPSSDHGDVYSSPLTIDSSTVVRAVAIREGFTTREITTASYLFVDDVLSQTRSSAIAAGFPSSWESNAGAPETDYGMDRSVIGPRDAFGGKYAETVRDDLLSVPSISLVMDQNDLFGETGIYSNPGGRGETWERPTSVEIIYPNGEDGLQVNAGIRVQGGISRVISSKLSLRLVFREQYGDSKLSFPLFGDDGPSEFDSIALRSSSGEQIVGRHYIRDEFLRRTQLATGNPSARGTFMHLYINGVYWGLYNPTEKIDAQFAVNYDGGQKEDYDVFNAGDLGGEGVTAINGTRESWDELLDRVRAVRIAGTQSAKTTALLHLEGKDSNGEIDEETEAYLDIDNFIDYLIVNVYAANRDWPHRNYYMYRKRGPDSDGFKFQVWDAEFSIDAGETSLRMSNLKDGPTVILPDLMTSDAFAVRFSDRAQKLFSLGGPLYVNPAARIWDPEKPFNNVPAERYSQLADEIRSPLVPESARWGDEGFGGELFTRDEDWQTLVDRNLRTFFASRSRGFLAGLRSDDLYEEAPTFSVMPGPVEAGTRVTLTSNNVVDIYYTLDGSDPRIPNGGIAESAIKLQSDIPISQRTTIHARSRAAGKWSAIQSGTFLVGSIPASESNLIISEINYNPHDALPAFGELDVGNDQFEFVEIRNISASTVDLSGVRLTQQFSRGIDFAFGEQLLAAGESVVIPRNVTAVKSRYEISQLAVGESPNPNHWHFDGTLGNGGDSLRMLDAVGMLIQSIRYDDSDEWPERADGSGSSLEVIDHSGDLSNPANWRSSSEFGGSPGKTGLGPDNRIVINEVRANSAAPLVDQIELKNTTNGSIDIEDWYLSDSNDDYFKYQFGRSTTIARNGYWSILESEFEFDLNGLEGDDLFLIEADNNGRPLRFVDRAKFEPMRVNSTLARWPDGQGRFYPANEPSFGVVNSGPQIGSVVISEIHASANPEGVDGISEGRELEFVELYNRTSDAIDVSSWTITGDIGFDFAPNSSIEPDSAVVIVGFDPIAEPTKAALFSLLYQSGGRLVGPYVETLQDSSGVVRLAQPIDVVNADSRVTVDEVRYDTVNSWPDDVLRTDKSLQRVTASAFGSHSTSWNSLRATPGTAAFHGLVGDVTEDGVVDIRDVDAVCSAINANDGAMGTDLNGDGATDTSDLSILIVDILGTTTGDANLDGVFNSRDFVTVFQASSFEDDIEDNASWATGDWNCDGDFTTQDFVVAFQSASYSAMSSVMSVPVWTAASRFSTASAAIRDFRDTEQTERNHLKLESLAHSWKSDRARMLDSRNVDSLFAS